MSEVDIPVFCVSQVAGRYCVAVKKGDTKIVLFVNLCNNRKITRSQSSGGAAACGNFAERTAMQFVLLKAHWQIKLI